MVLIVIALEWKENKGIQSYLSRSQICFFIFHFSGVVLIFTFNSNRVINLKPAIIYYRPTFVFSLF